MSKQDVKIWQRALSEMGLYSGKIDGDFGPGTRRASFETINEGDAIEVPKGADISARLHGVSASTTVDVKEVRFWGHQIG